MTSKHSWSQRLEPMVGAEATESVSRSELFPFYIYRSDKKVVFFIQKNQGVQSSEELSGWNGSTFGISDHVPGWHPASLTRGLCPSAQKCIRFNPDATVWVAKQRILCSLNQSLKDVLNYGLFQPASDGRDGKFLDEERLLRAYPQPAGRGIPSLEVLVTASEPGRDGGGRTFPQLHICFGLWEIALSSGQWCAFSRSWQILS